jgi:tRNA (cmo5U34)-methyltransferase
VVKPSDLNYDQYANTQYDRDIINAIPYHRDVHEEIGKFVQTHFARVGGLDILELGCGTGLTTHFIRRLCPDAVFHLIDFSENMMAGAKERLGEKNVTYDVSDYGKMIFPKEKYDLVISVIGLHHQEDEGKKTLFDRIFETLKPGGVFVFGDLVTHKDQHEAALQHAYHYHHLVKQAQDEKTLREWAYHHMYLNRLAPIEDQEEWLRDSGFDVERVFLRMNTALLICRKQ